MLKITGTILVHRKTKQFNSEAMSSVAQQIRELSKTYQFGIVLGGGNIFRGDIQTHTLGISPAVGHQIGMMSTIINTLIVGDVFKKHAIETTHYCAFSCGSIGKPLSIQELDNALERNHVILFSAGTGNPFFTTDTAAVMRGLQIGADEIWKGTDVDGIYSADPKKNPNAQRISTISYSQALNQGIKIMDATAYTLAQKYNQRIRIFNIFIKESLHHVAQDCAFGSTIKKDSL